MQIMQKCMYYIRTYCVYIYRPLYIYIVCILYILNMLNMWQTYGSIEELGDFLKCNSDVNDWTLFLFNIADVCQEPPDEEMAKVAAGADGRRQEV